MSEIFVNIPCVVKTPQFKGGKIDRHHTQAGVYNEKTKTFTPDNFENGNHIIHIESNKKLLEILVKKL